METDIFKSLSKIYYKYIKDIHMEVYYKSVMETLVLYHFCVTRRVVRATFQPCWKLVFFDTMTAGNVLFERNFQQ